MVSSRNNTYITPSKAKGLVYQSLQRANTEPFKNSFFIKTVLDWNHLDDNTVLVQFEELQNCSPLSNILTKSYSAPHSVEVKSRSGSIDVLYTDTDSTVLT